MTSVEREDRISEERNDSLTSLDRIKQELIPFFKKFKHIAAFGYHGETTWFSSKIQRLMINLTISIARFPCVVIFFCLSFTAICSLGLMSFHLDTSFVLFIPTESKSFDNVEDMARLFPLGPAPQLNQILVVAPNDTNILAQSFVDTFWEIDQLIRSFVVNGSGISFSDVCQKVLRSSPSLECKRLGFLKFWDSYEEYLLDIHNDTDILSTINSPSYPDGTPVWPEEYMGNIERDNQGNVISAAAVLLQYPTFENHRIYSKLNVIEPGTALWETGSSNIC